MKIKYILLFIIFCSGCEKDIPVQHINQNTPFNLIAPAGFPSFNNNLEVTNKGVELGRKLFYENKLSQNNQMSCASCHIQEFGFSNGTRYSVGVLGVPGELNAPSLSNLMWSSSFNWNGNVDLLEEQAFRPVTHPNELAENWINVVNKLKNDPQYPPLFEAAFGTQEIDSILITNAIAQFEKTMISSNSKFDKYLKGEAQLTPSELNGFLLFNQDPLINGKGGDCFHCHGGQNNLLFHDNMLHNNGLDSTQYLSPGLYLITGDPLDKGKFRTPTLRNIEFSAPYMHDGRFETLEEVIEHYNSGGVYSSTIDPLMKFNGIGLNLTEQDKIDLVAFLKTLSDYEYITNNNFSNPHE